MGRATARQTRHTEPKISVGKALSPRALAALLAAFHAEACVNKPLAALASLGPFFRAQHPHLLSQHGGGFPCRKKALRPTQPNQTHATTQPQPPHQPQPQLPQTRNDWGPGFSSLPPGRSRFCVHHPVVVPSSPCGSLVVAPLLHPTKQYSLDQRLHCLPFSTHPLNHEQQQQQQQRQETQRQHRRVRRRRWQQEAQGRHGLPRLVRPRSSPCPHHRYNHPTS